MFLALLLLIVGFAILIKGADFFVNGASSVAKKFNISNLAIGLTVVAFGTSTPEFIVSFYSALEGRNDASFGNIIGSNNFNLLFILGIAGLIYPLTVQRNTVRYEVPISLLAALVLYMVVNDQILMDNPTNMLSRWDALILLVFFGLFMMYIYRTMTTASDFEETPIKMYATPLATGMIILGLAMLIGGGTLVVDNAVAIAEHYGLSQKLIGLTILAAGTSLPELATSAVAAYRKNTDIAIGNVIGSNIFNIFFILGVTGLINPIPYNDVMNFDIEVLGASTLLLMVFMFTINQRKLDRWEAFLLLVGYVGYTVYLVVTDPGV
jgi:cation:H+ antiporter